MPPKVRSAEIPVHTGGSYPVQLRLPLMARETRPNGLPSPNPDIVEPFRLFLTKRSAATAKDVAAATGARSSRVHEEDEGRVVHSTGTSLARFLTLPARDQRRFLNALCDLAALPPYAEDERDMDDSLVGMAGGR